MRNISISIYKILLASIAFNLYSVIPELKRLSQNLNTLNDSINDNNVPLLDEKQLLKNVLNQMYMQTHQEAKCALLFFGLPRCYHQALVSIKENIVSRNPSCHIYLHTYNLTVLPSNKLNSEKDKPINIDEVYTLTNNVTMSSIEEFHLKRNVSYYRQYFPTNQNWLYPTSMDNMIKQWHSIESVWNYMESFGIDYTHVGLFRTDQIYKSPIYIIDEQHTGSDYAVRANYGLTSARYKFFNDRLFYGTYKYTKAWAKYRFSFVDEYLKINDTYADKRGLHSETFLYYLMKKYVKNVYVDDTICAERVRNDCRKRSDCAVSKEVKKKRAARRKKFRKE